MIFHILLVLVGLAVLLGAGELLVRGSVSLARQLNVPSLLIGLTIVAFGTSAPELVVSVQAVLAGNNGIAIGNIVGSNIANILLVLGLPALVAPIALTCAGVKRHAGVLIAASLVFAYIVYGWERLDPTMGMILMGLIIVYIIYIGIHAARKGQDDEGLLDEVEEIAGNLPGWKTGAFVIAGLIGLPLGGGLLVHHGAEIARALSVRDEVIGLTIVAFGTSLPELATVWAAALKREADVAVGNVVGSNIFNILFVGGAAGMVGTTTFDHGTRTLDMPVMLASAVILSLMIFARSTITRLLGLVFTLAYVAYILFIGSGGTVSF